MAAQRLQATGSRTWTHRSLFKLWTHDLLVRPVVSVQHEWSKHHLRLFSGNEKDWGGFKDDFTTFAQCHGFAYVLTSQRRIKIIAITTAQLVIAEGFMREQYDNALNARYALKQSAYYALRASSYCSLVYPAITDCAVVVALILICR